MKQHDLIVGHDNGNSGGTVALHPNGSIFKYWANPTVVRDGMREVDVLALRDLIESCNLNRILFAVEEPLKRLISSTPSMWNNYGAMRAMIILQPNWDFIAVGVNEWQKKILGRVPKGMTKKVALVKAKNIWPKETWLANERCRTPHDGIVDAALIAHYTSDRIRNTNSKG